MNYIRAIASTTFLSIPFIFIWEYAFNILQIPFALIHKYAVRMVFVYRMYILCQFYAILTSIYAETYGISPVPLLIFESLLLWFSLSSALPQTRRNDCETGSNHSSFVTITGFCSLPALWLIYYFNISILNQPVLWFLWLITLIYAIPIIGSILKFFTNATTGFALLFFVIITAVLIQKISVSMTKILQNKKASPASFADSNSNVLPEQDTTEDIFSHIISDTTKQNHNRLDNTQKDKIKKWAFIFAFVFVLLFLIIYEYSSSVVINTYGTEGFTYENKKREVTFGSGSLAVKETLTGDDLQRFEELRFEEYSKNYALLSNGLIELQNNAEGEEKNARNKEFAKIMKELKKQGVINYEQYNELYNRYSSGDVVEVPSVTFVSGAKVERVMSYNDLTREQKLEYMKELASQCKNGNITKEEYKSYRAAALAGDEVKVKVKGYLISAYDTLSEEDKKAVHKALNTKATKAAKERWKSLLSHNELPQ